MLHFSAYQLLNLAHSEMVFGRSVIDGFVCDVLLTIRRYAVVRHEPDPTGTAQSHVTEIDQNADHPRRESRLLTKQADMRVCFPERVLNLVCGILAITENSGCNGEAQTISAPYQFLKSSAISLLRTFD